MNNDIKEILEEALKVVKEPITVNSIEYKYFDRENYNKLVDVIDYCNYLNIHVKPYVEAQDKEITRLNKENEKLHKELDYANNDNIYYIAKIDKAIELLKEAGCYDEETKTFCDDVWEELPKLLNILEGSDKE